MAQKFNVVKRRRFCLIACCIVVILAGVTWVTVRKSDQDIGPALSWALFVGTPSSGAYPNKGQRMRRSAGRNSRH